MTSHQYYYESHHSNLSGQNIEPIEQTILKMRTQKRAYQKYKKSP